MEEDEEYLKKQELKEIYEEKKKTKDQMIAEEADNLRKMIEETDKKVDLLKIEKKQVEESLKYFRKRLKFLTPQEPNYSDIKHKQDRLQFELSDTNENTIAGQLKKSENFLNLKLSELKALYGEQTRTKNYSYEYKGRKRIFKVASTEDAVQLADEILFKSKINNEYNDYLPKFNAIANKMQNQEINVIKDECIKNISNENERKDCINQKTIDIQNHYIEQKNKIFKNNYITDPNTYLIRNKLKFIENEQSPELLKLTPNMLSYKYSSIISGNYLDELPSSNLNDEFSCIIGDNVKLRNIKKLDYKNVVKSKQDFLNFLNEYEQKQINEKANYQMEFKKPYPGITKDNGFKIPIGDMIFSTKKLRKWVEDTIEKDIENKNDNTLFENNKSFFMISSKLGMYPLFMGVKNEKDKEEIICMLKPENEDKFLDLMANSIMIQPEIFRNFDAKSIVKELSNIRKRKIGD